MTDVPKISGAPLRIAKDRTVPVPRYDLFISAFEKKVAEYQQQIRKIERLERVYNVLKEVGESFKLPNDQKLNLEAARVELHINATPDDTLKTFTKLAEAVGAKLKEAGLHRDGVPAISTAGTTVFHKFHIMDKASNELLATACINVTLPDIGTRDATIRKELRTYSYHEYKIAARDEILPIGWHQS